MSIASETQIFSDASVNESELSSSESRQALRWMIFARVLEDKYRSLYRSGKITGGCYLGRGQESLSVACGISLQPGDIFAPLIRDQAGRFAFGEPLLDSVRTYLGSVEGPMRGRDGNIHRGRPKEGLLAMISHLGAMISAVTGALLARKMRGRTGTVGLASIGDGGTSTGAFHEGLNLASVEKVPLVVVVANNQYAYSTPNSRQFACEDLADRAAGYGIQAWRVDATDLLANLATIGAAVKQARETSEPQLVVARLLRQGGHGEHDDAGYVAERLKSESLGRDCMDVAKQQLLDREWLTASDLEQWEAEAHDQVNTAVEKVQREAVPSADAENWHAISSTHLLERHQEFL
ncbi:MAG: thiamine pyrophosphate-dependent dehydrogenase E1 component subunit alpha [Verrucomicrobiales bacterium]